MSVLKFLFRIKILLCESHWIDQMFVKVVSYPCGFLRIECECVRYECFELIISILSLFINSESDCLRVFITTHWFTMTKDTDYDFEYNFPNHLHLNINTLIHSHLMLSKSSLSQRNKDKDQCWKQSIEAHLHFNSFQSITLQSHFIHVSEAIPRSIISR